MSFNNLSFEEDSQTDNFENDTQNQNTQNPNTQDLNTQNSNTNQDQQTMQQVVIKTCKVKPGSLDYKTVYEASMKELVNCQTFVKLYTRKDQLEFLDQFKHDLFYLIQQPIEVQYYVLMMTIAGQRLTDQISLPYLLRDKELLKDLITEATNVFIDFTPDNIKDLFVEQLRWLISQIDIVKQLNPINVIYIQQMQYDLPPIYLTRLIIRLVELVVLHSYEFEDVSIKLTDLKNNFNLEFKQEALQRQPLLYVIWKQDSQTIERIGKRKIVYEHPLCQFALNETFIKSILSIDEHLLAMNEDYYNLIQVYFQSPGHTYMQTINEDTNDANKQDDNKQNSHTAQSSNTPQSLNTTKNTCVICYEDLPINQFVKFDKCPHNNVCQKCFIDMIKAQQTPIFYCPTCKKEIVDIEVQCQDQLIKFRI